MPKAGADDRADSIYFPHATILLLFYPFLFKISHNVLTANFFSFSYIFSGKRKSLFSLKTGFFASCVICFMTRCSVYAA
ncbi:hypothetical protein BCBMB205_31960 [Bacillus sp. CN2]|nr:hypothetical protein BCBMB205_31960 [Bacillus velezensis]ARZ59542.1 hypothetical protein BAGQ_3337 [Bacillus velezensis]GFR54616.1 hypothetical protein BCBMB205_31960 [Bacillus sp. CN2]